MKRFNELRIIVAGYSRFHLMADDHKFPTGKLFPSDRISLLNTSIFPGINKCNVVYRYIFICMNIDAYMDNINSRFVYSYLINSRMEFKVFFIFC